MKDKGSIISTIVLVSIFVIFTISQVVLVDPVNGVSDYPFENISNGVCVLQCSGNSFSLYNLLLEIPIVTIIAIVVWRFTTKSERKNRKYTRGKIVNRYLSCLAVAGALLSVPSNRTNMQNLLDFVANNFQQIIDRSNQHAHLLNGNEIDNFVGEKSHLLNTFTNNLIANPNDEELLREFYDYIRQILSDYIKNYKLKEFNVYVIKE